MFRRSGDWSHGLIRFERKIPVWRAGVLATCCLFFLPVQGEEIVVSARVMGPVSNVYAISTDGANKTKNPVKKITENIRWRDIDADANAAGDVVFSSNREVNARVDIHRHSENFDLYVARENSGEATPLTSTAQNEMLPRFSRDGKRVAFVRGRNQLVVMDVESMRERVLYEEREILDFDWAADGKSLAVAARNREFGKILQVRCAIDCLSDRLQMNTLKTYSRLHDSKEVMDQVVAASFGSVDHLRWSPDGKFLAFIFHPDGNAVRSLFLLETESGGLTRISGASQQVQSPLTWSADGRALLYAALVDYRFFYDETEQRKVYEGAMQIFRSDLKGELENLTPDTVAARAPVFIGRDRIAYLQAEQLAARQYALVLRNLDGGETRQLFDRVSPDSHLAVRR